MNKNLEKLRNSLWDIDEYLELIWVGDYDVNFTSGVSYSHFGLVICIFDEDENRRFPFTEDYYLDFTPLTKEDLGKIGEIVDNYIKDNLRGRGETEFIPKS